MKKILSLFAALLFVGSMWGVQYELVTSTSDLVAGAKYLIGTGTNGTVSFVSTANKGNNRDLTSGTVSSSKVTKTDAMMALTLGGSTGAWTFATNGYAGTAGYLNATNTTNNNYLQVKADLDNYAKFSISFSSNTAVITCTGKSSRNVMRCNTSSSIISCYTSGYDAVYLYKEVVDENQVVAPTFSPAAGSYLGTQSVTIGSTTDGASIYYTMGESPADPTTSSTLYNGAIQVSASTTIKAIAVKTGMTNSDVTSATYTIYNTEKAGTAEAPFTVADARMAIDYGTSEQKSNKYATGTVSAIVTALSSGKITYDLSTDGTTASDQLRAYGGKGIGGANFTSTDDIRVGDEVIVKGDLTKYNSVYEFAADNQLVSYVARTPKFTIADVPYLSTEAEDLAVEDLTVTKEGAGTITLVSGNNEIATIVDNKIHPVATGEVTITATLAANGYWREKETTFTVSVAVPCHSFVTLSIGTSATAGCSFTADQAAGEYPTCDDDFVVVVTPTIKAHWHVDEVQAPNSSNISDPDEDGKYTITYARNTNAASQINVTFAEDTKYEVNWYANEALIATESYYYDQKISEHAAPAALSSIYQEKEFIGWVAAEIDGAAEVQPELVDFTDMAAAAKTFYALYATATKTADATLTKMVAGNTLADGDKIVIVARSNKLGLYQETISSSWVKNWSFTGDDPVVGDIDDNKKYLNVTASNSKWKLGDATNGYLYNSSSTNLEASTENSSEWSFTDNNDGTFTLTAGQKLTCRTDMTSGNVNKWRCSDNNGTRNLHLYKYVPDIYTHSAYVTTVPEHAYTVKWSIGEATEELGAMPRMDDAPTYEWSVAEKSILNAATYTVKVFRDDETDPVETKDLVINPNGTYSLRFTYKPAAEDPTKVLEFESIRKGDVNTAVDNTELSNKAVKFIQNGQMFIELNGRVYNAFGQTVK